MYRNSQRVAERDSTARFSTEKVFLADLCRDGVWSPSSEVRANSKRKYLQKIILNNVRVEEEHSRCHTPLIICIKYKDDIVFLQNWTTCGEFDERQERAKHDKDVAFLQCNISGILQVYRKCACTKALRINRLRRVIKQRQQKQIGLNIVLRIRDVYPGSWIKLFFILDPGSEFFSSRIPVPGSQNRIKNLSILTPKNGF